MLCAAYAPRGACVRNGLSDLTGGPAAQPHHRAGTMPDAID